MPAIPPGQLVFSHNGWTTEEQDFLFIGDEIDDDRLVGRLLDGHTELLVADIPDAEEVERRLELEFCSLHDVAVHDADDHALRLDHTVDPGLRRGSQMPVGHGDTGWHRDRQCIVGPGRRLHNGVEAASDLLARQHQHRAALVGRLERVEPDLSPVQLSGHRP